MRPDAFDEYEVKGAGVRREKPFQMRKAIVDPEDRSVGVKRLSPFSNTPGWLNGDDLMALRRKHRRVVSWSRSHVQHSSRTGRHEVCNVAMDVMEREPVREEC